MDHLKPKRYPYILRSTSVCVGGLRLHLQYGKFQNDRCCYRLVESSRGAILRDNARIPSKKHVELLWA